LLLALLTLALAHPCLDLPTVQPEQARKGPSLASTAQAPRPRDIDTLEATALFPDGTPEARLAAEQAAWGLGHIDDEAAREALVRVACHGPGTPRTMALRQLARAPRRADIPLFAKQFHEAFAKKAIWQVDEDWYGAYHSARHGSVRVPSLRDDPEGPRFPQTTSRFPERPPRNPSHEFWEVPSAEAPDADWTVTSVAAVVTEWDTLDATQQTRALEALKHWWPEVDPPLPRSVGAVLLAHLADPAVTPQPWVAATMFADPAGFMDLLRSSPFHEGRLFPNALKPHTHPEEAVAPLVELLHEPRHGREVAGAIRSLALRPHVVEGIRDGTFQLDSHGTAFVAGYPPLSTDVDWLVEALRGGPFRPPELAPDVAIEVQRRMLDDPARGGMSDAQRRSHTWTALGLHDDEAVLLAALNDDDVATAQGALERVPRLPPPHLLEASLATVERCVAAGEQEGRYCLQVFRTMAPAEAFAHFGSKMPPTRATLNPLLRTATAVSTQTLSTLLRDESWSEHHDAIAAALQHRDIDEPTRQLVDQQLTPRWRTVK